MDVRVTHVYEKKLERLRKAAAEGSASFNVQRAWLEGFLVAVRSIEGATIVEYGHETEELSRIEEEAHRLRHKV